jgi:sugar phosphate isomerase/epimerase
MEYLVEAIRECAAAAAETGVRFALEPLNRYETDLVHTVAEGLELADRIGAENFGLLLDTFHMNIEEPVIEDSIRACGNRIFHFHVADSNRWYPGAGHLDFGTILETSPPPATRASSPGSSSRCRMPTRLPSVGSGT